MTVSFQQLLYPECDGLLDDDPNAVSYASEVVIVAITVPIPSLFYRRERSPTTTNALFIRIEP